ncbi:MAG: aldo/keto reductase [Tissierellia bacterium]|nr:aldo/keto reductase [Tissierellia bacterium]
MKYRNFTKDNLQVSQLGFGCMRLPVLDGDNTKIDEAMASKMLDRAMEAGINYYDTAYIYHGENSESFVGDYFEKRGDREDIYLATKLPVWKMDKPEDTRRFLNEQLRRLKTDYIDFYLLHTLDAEEWEKVKDFQVIEELFRAREEGLIRYLGFSFHDDYGVFEDILSHHDWDFCQIQLNYLDVNHQAGLRGLKLAGDRGISLVIMEPVKGGKLANPPEEVMALWEGSSRDLSPAGHALAFLWNQEEVSVVLSGMTTMDQLEDNLRVADAISPGSLSKEDWALYDQAKAIFDERIQIACTACDYCQPCPQGVKIPKIFTMYNDLYIFGEDKNRDQYKKLLEEGGGADQCVACGQCEGECPQHLEIIQGLKDAHEALS